MQIIDHPAYWFVSLGLIFAGTMLEVIAQYVK